MELKLIENNKHKFYYLDKNTPKLEPMLELYKGKLFSFLIKLFITDCVNNFGIEIFSIKKSYSRTLTNLLSSWIFSLYIDYDFSKDYFFPENYDNISLLEYTLRDFCKYDTKIENITEKIKIVTDNLKKNYKMQLEGLNNYRNSNIYKNNKTNYKIKKSIINIKNNKYNQDILFYKFEIIVKFVIKDKRLINILDNILLPIKIYEKLEKIYSGEENFMDNYLWAVIYRYQLLGSNNHQLAVLPSIMNSMYNDYNLNFECFASCINNTFNNYCSIYYDIEKYFGSYGSFFNIIPVKGTFGFNPPYQKDIIEIGINRLFEFLEKEEDLIFIITIPIWDDKGRSVMKEQFNNELEKQNIDYGDFDIINKVRDSKYFRNLRMIPKEKFTYIDHNFELYKNKTIQNTYVIILSNINIDNKYLDNYSFL